MKPLRKFWNWIDDRTGISEFIDPLAKHLVPPDSTWLYVFGSATLFCFILQVVTGVALAFLYQPSTETAYESLKYITNEAPFGNILRGLHFFGASAMIFLVGIHMLRVYIMAAYKYPREMSWITGSVLLLLTVTMGFTGQLLRWDSNGVWSAFVGAEQAGRTPVIGNPFAYILLGGKTMGGATLSRFFAIHVFLIPALLFGLIGLHIYLVIRNGISEPPKAGRKVDRKTYREWYQAMLREKGVPFWPNAGWRDGLFGIIVIVFILILAILFGPPKIDAPPDPSNIFANPRPDWYFLWIFALFALMPRQVETYAIAFSPLIIGAILIMLPLLFSEGERSPYRRPWTIVMSVIMVTVIGTFWYIGTKAPWSPSFEAKPLSTEIVGKVTPVEANGANLFYTKACIYCHVISGNGGPRGPDLTDVGNRLTKDELIIRIVNGSNNMPSYGATLSAIDLNDLVSFLLTRRK